MAELTVPQINFAALGELPQIYRQGQADALRRQTLANLGQGGAADADALLRSGDLSLAQLGISLRNRQEDQARQARQDAFQREESARAQRNADRSYSLQERAANRADDKTPTGFMADPNNPGSYIAIPGGPQDPSYLASRAEAIARAEAASGGKNGLQPVYGVDAQGKPVIMQMNPSGVATRTQLPEGVTVSKEPIRIDRGTDFLLLDPITRQPIGTVPKDLAGAETAKVVGEETGKAQVALPQVLSTANQTLQSIEQVRNHPGRQYATGALGSIPGVPGTSQRGFIAALDQLKGKTFLEAFNALRGGGAITEAEGAKATNAMARLDRAQNKEDFETALNDLRDVVKSGMLRAQAKARGAGQPQSSGASASSAGAVVDWRTYFGGGQ